MIGVPIDLIFVKDDQLAESNIIMNDFDKIRRTGWDPPPPRVCSASRTTCLLGLSLGTSLTLGRSFSVMFGFSSL